MQKKQKLLLQSLVFAALGVLLLFMSFRKTPVDSLLEVMKEGNYSVMIPVFLVSLLVYLSRVKRWQILFESIGIQVSSKYLFASLASGYLVNFAVPRLGELSRALILKKYLDIPVNTSLSTVVFERLVDILCLAIILLMAFALELLNKGTLLKHFTEGLQIITPAKIALLLVILLLGIVFLYVIKQRKDRLSLWLNELLTGVLELLKLKKRGWFLFHTLVIWIGFYLMTYLWFFMFEESRLLSAYQAFLVLVLGIVARSLPIQAGSAGAYHFVVSQSLLLMGVSLSTGNALAIIIHGFQTILTIIFGAGAYLWLLIQERNEARQKNIEKT